MLKAGCGPLVAVVGFLPFVAVSQAQDREITGTIRSYDQYNGGMICEVPEADVNAVQQIVGSNSRGTDDRILGTLGHFVTERDEIECSIAKAQSGTYAFRLPLVPNTRLVVVFLRGGGKHAAFYEVDRAPGQSDANTADRGLGDIIVDPPHD